MAVNIPSGQLESIATAAELVAAIAAVALIIYYKRLHDANKRQIQALQARYAPYLDVTFLPQKEYFAFQVINRGGGSAHEIELHVEVSKDGGHYHHVSKFNTSLSPGQALSESMHSPSPPEIEDLDYSPIVFSPVMVPIDDKMCKLYDLLGLPVSSPSKAQITIRFLYSDVEKEKTRTEGIIDGEFTVYGQGLADVFGDPTITREGKITNGKYEDEVKARSVYPRIENEDKSVSARSR